MSDDPIEPVSDALDEWLSAERRRPDPSSDAQARVWDRVRDEVGPASSPLLSRPRPTARARHLWSALAGVLAGGAAGAAITAAILSGGEPPEPRVLLVEVPIAVSTEPARDDPARAFTPTAPPVEPPSVELRVDPPRRGPDRAGRTRDPARTSSIEEGTAEVQSTLGAERAIIDVARAAVSRGHPEEALDALARHAREFPEGLLREERDALVTIALYRTGRISEADDAAARFRATYPTSVFRASIERAGAGR
jgi:hypothetical protein